MDFVTSSACADRTGARRYAAPITPWLALLGALALAGCTGGAKVGPGAAQESPYYTVGGTVTGLTGSGLTLQNNNGDNLAVSAAGGFTFKTPLARGNSYSVSVLTQPSTPTQTCVVSNGSGTVTGDNVTNVTVTCADKVATTDMIGGSVAGLVGSGLVLQDNGADNLAVSSNGAFTFATPLPPGMPYAVTVLTPPMNPFQNCSIVNGTGTTGAADVNNIAISCKTNSNPAFTIGGTISGIAASGPITLQDNGTDNLTLTADGTFTFKTPIPSGSAYSVTAVSSATSLTRTCAFTNATGIVSGANVTNVTVSCTESTAIVNISANVSGLTGSGLVLQNNGADNLPVSANGLVTFATGIASGSPFNVTVLTQPQGQTCTVTNGSGAASSTAAPVAVTCTANSFSLSATVTGLLAGAQLTLNDPGATPLVVTANGTSSFANSIPYNGSYTVTVGAQPAGETCTVNNGSGSGVTANVTVTVTCSVLSYSVSAAVSGLTAGKQVILNDNGGNPLTVSANGTFAFSGAIAYNSSYAVTVATQPVGETCTVSNGSGAGITGNVTVGVTCSTITFTVSAAVSGLGAGVQVTLDNNGGNPLTFTTNTTQAFSTPVAYNGSYAVTVGTQPVGETCSVTNGSGSGVTANVTVTVTCSAITYTLSATVSGLTAGKQVTLDNNGANPLTFTTNTTQAFTTPVAYNGSYAVTVGTQPVGETCTVSNGTGSGVTANVTVTVNCAVTTFTVSATVSGLTAGLQVTLDNNGGNPLIFTTNTTQAFSTPVAYNGSYAVTVGTQPVGETCTVSNGSGSGVTANVTVAVSCAVTTFTVSATVSGLTAGQQVTLDNNGGNPLTFTTNSTQPFTTPVAYNGSYAVTVGTQPVGETCTVNSGSGSNVTANVTVTVTCAVTTFTVSATVSGLSGGAQVTLKDNGADPLTFTSNTTQTFATQIAYNGSYAVTVGTQPTGETCTVNNGSATNVTANATVTVSCVSSSFTIDAIISGLAAGQQVTLVNGSDSFIATGNGDYVFPAQVPYGGSYDVTVGVQPTTQTCTVSNGSGTNVTNDVSVPVSCATNYTVGGTVTGLFSEPLVLQLNGANNINVPAESSSFVFPTGLPTGSSYAVTVFQQAPGYFCDLGNSTGTIGTANVINVTVSCHPAVTTVALFAGSALGKFGPTNVTQDLNNNTYIVDFSNNEIREIDASGNVSTIAGNPVPGSADGVGTAASFNGPTGISVDTDGSLFIADTGNNEIRHIVPTSGPGGTTIWTVTTIAGSTTAGFADGSGTTALFHGPTGLLGGAVQLFVVDQQNNRIRLVSGSGSNWSVVTIAGSGVAGTADGIGTNAQFNLPTQITFTAGAVPYTYYITDQHNNEIRAMQADAASQYHVFTVAGAPTAGFANGTGASARFNQPSGITAGAACPPAAPCTDYVWVADALNNSIREMTVSDATLESTGTYENIGVVTTVANTAGTPGYVDSSSGAAARFNEPIGVYYCCGTNDIWISDFANEAIRQVDTSGSPGTTTSVYASFGFTDGTGSAALFHTPHGLATDSAGNVYVADTANNEIRMITPAGVVTTLAGSPTAGNADGTGSQAGFNGPTGVAVDSAGNVYVADSGNDEIRKITPAGVVSTIAGSTTPGNSNGTGTAATFNGPYCIAVDAGGNLYVGENVNLDIRKITPAGVVTTFAGSGQPGNANGTGTAASFNSPRGIAVDAFGNVYVAEDANNDIRMITQAGVVTTLAGSGAAGSADGAGKAATFNGPTGIAVDAPGNLYISDGGNNEVRQIQAGTGGEVVTLAGSLAIGNINGASTSATFNAPSGIAVDPSGNVFVADTVNNEIREIVTQ